jgi:GTP-binding protein HflX
VGYTNAGKSRLLHSLTNKKVKVKDELFATLDSRIGKVYLPEIQRNVLISDTIGFIRDLPPELIEAFHSTLVETIHSDLLLHIIDCSDFEMDWKMKVVNEVLEKLECSKKPIIYAFNKIDLLGQARKADILKQFDHLNPILVSAEEKTNLDKLKESISHNLS